jgi:hypothetical protein
MARHYHLPEDLVKVVVPVSGRYLAHNRLNAIERAFLAADLHEGAAELVAPTLKQAAHLARINPTYAWWAAKRLAERAAIEAREIPLVPPRLVKTNGHALSVVPVREINELTLISIARTVGSDRMLQAACAAEAAE